MVVPVAVAPTRRSARLSNAHSKGDMNGTQASQSDALGDQQDARKGTKAETVRGRLQKPLPVDSSAPTEDTVLGETNTKKSDATRGRSQATNPTAKTAKRARSKSVRDTNLPLKVARTVHSRGVARPIETTPVTDYNMDVSPFDSCRFTAGISPFDSQHRDNVLEAPEYVADILQRLYRAEVSFCMLFYLFT